MLIYCLPPLPDPKIRIMNRSLKEMGISLIDHLGQDSSRQKEQEQNSDVNFKNSVVGVEKIFFWYLFSPLFIEL